MDMIQYCPECKANKWFDNSEYSPDHLQIKCSECGCELYSDLKFHKMEE